MKVCAFCEGYMQFSLGFQEVVVSNEARSINGHHPFMVLL